MEDFSDLTKTIFVLSEEERTLLGIEQEKLQKAWRESRRKSKRARIKKRIKSKKKRKRIYLTNHI